MKFIADLHLHSKYSAATSSQADLPHFYVWALIKGIDVVATSDFTHPKWFAELKDQLEPDGTGLFDLKPSAMKAVAADLKEWNLPADRPVKFLLSSEISSIYRKNEKTRKIHNLACFDSFESAERYTKKLGKLGNISYDGRPILGVDAKDLLSIVLEVSDRNMFIPAHIWTPWFSLFGSKSGFDSIEECFEDLTPHVTALETGLSSDPPMNWMVSSLDRFNLVSNSDAHSPQKLGREANLFDTDLTFGGISASLRDVTSPGLTGTLEFFPEEGKYHNDGHRDCGVNIPPGEAIKNANNCPVCGKPLTIGVLHRVLELADREYGRRPPNARNFESLVPLTQIIAESYGSLSAKKTDEVYRHMVRNLGPEFHVLRTAEIAEIAKASNDVIAEGVSRIRKGQVSRFPGFDGEFGTISLFSAEERDRLMKQDTLFSIVANRKARSPENSKKEKIRPSAAEKKAVQAPRTLEQRQQEAVDCPTWPVIVTAGPGTGKTFVLTEKIKSLIEREPSLAGRVAAITFTRKAGDELRQRLGIASEWVGTIHSICLKILKSSDPGLTVIAPAESELILSSELGISKPAEEQKRISLLKGTGIENKKDPVQDAYDRYLRENRLVDFDDIIVECRKLVAADPAVRTRLAKELYCLFVDEFQDVNRSQYLLILELARLLENRLFVIGDPDQSIYGFRGAEAGVFEKLKKDLPGPKSFSLGLNFRSADVIIRMSNLLIKDEKKSIAAKETPGRIFRLDFGSELAEAVFIAKTVSRKIGGRDMLESARHSAKTQGMGLNDFGVLVRTVRQTRVIVDCLSREGFPVRIRDATELIRSAEARIAINMMKLLLDPQDPMAQLFFRKADFPFEKLFAKFLKQRGRYLGDSEALLKDLSKTVDFKDKAVLEELVSVARAHPGASGFLDLMLYRDPTEVEAARKKIPREAVSVLTMHASKGLEFPVVFIAGVSEGLIPCHTVDAIGDQELAEELRLFYVAVTRAGRELYLTRSLTSSRFGKTVKTGASRFLEGVDPGFFSAVEKGKIRGKNPQMELPL